MPEVRERALDAAVAPGRVLAGEPEHEGADLGGDAGTADAPRRVRAPGQQTEAGQTKAEFWAAYADYLEERGAPFRSPNAKPWNWQGWGIGRSYFQLAAAVNVQDKRNAVYLNLSGPDAEAHYQLLRDQREEIESALGFQVEWEKGAKERKLIVPRTGDTTDRANWPEQHRWLHETMLAFQRVFQPMVRDLDASEWADAEDDL